MQLKGFQQSIQIFLIALVGFLPVFTYAASFSLGQAFSATFSFLDEYLFEEISGVLFGLLTQFFIAITVFVANIFNAMISATIVEFGTYFGGLEEGINAAWKIFRDVANIVFIGMFIYVAFNKILGTEKFDATKLIARIIIVALLVNFSLFFTKVAIDLSNAVAVQFYKQIVEQNQGQNIAEIFFADAGLAKFAQTNSLLTAIVGEANAVSSTMDVAESGGTIMVMVYSMLVITAAIFMTSVFVYGIFMLLSRAVGFVVLMVSAPLAFVANTVPQTESYFRLWWTTLLKYAIFAPMFMLFIWGSLQILTHIDTNFTELIKAAAGDFSATEFAQAVVNMVIAIGLLYVSIDASSKLSLKGTEIAVNLSRKVMGKGLALSPAVLTGRAIARGTGSATAWTADKLRTLNAYSLKSKAIDQALAKVDKQIKEGNLAPLKVAGLDKTLQDKFGLQPAKSRKEQEQQTKESLRSFAEYKVGKELERAKKQEPEIVAQTEKALRQEAASTAPVIAKEPDVRRQSYEGILSAEKREASEKRQALQTAVTNLANEINNLASKPNLTGDEATKLASLEKQKAEAQQMIREATGKITAIDKMQRRLVQDYANANTDQEKEQILRQIEQELTQIQSPTTTALYQIQNAIKTLSDEKKYKQFYEQAAKQVLTDKNIASDEQELKAVATPTTILNKPKYLEKEVKAGTQKAVGELDNERLKHVYRYKDDTAKKLLKQLEELNKSSGSGKS